MKAITLLEFVWYSLNHFRGGVHVVLLKDIDKWLREKGRR